jgi:hypothetical protein
LKEVGKLLVIVYGARSTTDIPLAMRAKWIRSLYPMVELIEAPGAPEETGTSPEIRRLHEDFLVSLIAGRRIDAFYSSETYGEYASRVLGCVNRIVDKDRLSVPVSSTLIRDNPLAARDWLCPLVRADLEAIREKSNE